VKVCLVCRSRLEREPARFAAGRSARIAGTQEIHASFWSEALRVGEAARSCRSLIASDGAELRERRAPGTSETERRPRA